MEVKLGTFDVLLLRALRAFRTRWLQSTSEPADGVRTSRDGLGPAELDLPHAKPAGGV